MGPIQSSELIMQLQINWRIPTLWLLDVWIAWH